MEGKQDTPLHIGAAEPTLHGETFSARVGRVYRDVVVDDKQVLRDYLSAVTDESADYIGTLTEADLAEVIDESWEPPVTRGVRLISVYADALQHIGQAAYVVGTTG